MPRSAHRSSTRRRLIATFSCVLAAVVSPVPFEIVALHRMEATFEAMKDHEEQMSLVLQLEDAVREQYAHEAHVVLGESSHLADYDKARGRTVDLGGALSGRVDEPDAIALLDAVVGASGDLDRRFREEVAPAMRDDPALARQKHERSHPRMDRIEHDIDQLFARLQDAEKAFRTELEGMQRAALRWAVILLVATPLFVTGAVIYLSRSVAVPLAKLSAGASAIAGGDFDARIDVASPDEFGALAGEFNQMTDALKQHQQRLVASEKLAGIGRLAAGVAHELNNPLQVVLGYLSLHRDIPDRRLAEQLGVIEAEVLHCKEIVEGLLELSRPSVSPTVVDLRSLCDDVAVGLRLASRPDAVELSTSGDALALGDRPKLRQVIFNLVKNALEASGPEGRVAIVVGATAVLAEVSVSDSGPGIAPGVRARLFEPFFTTKSNGTGMGLAVSRAIALAHGGDIHATNGAAGGAVFTLRLPRVTNGRA